jgi:hypothetical protein
MLRARVIAIPKKRVLLAIIGILGLLVILVVYLLQNGSSDGYDKVAAGRPRRTARGHGPDSAGDSKLSGELAADRQGQVLSEHRVEDLAKFILPLVEGREASFHGAVKILMEAYNDACYRTQTKPLALEFSLPEETSARLWFSIERANFDAALKHLAALAGYTVRIDGLGVSFEPVPDSEVVVSKTHPMGIGQAAVLKRQLRRLERLADPSLAGMVASAGLAAPNRTLAFQPGGVLQAALTPAEHIKLETWLAALSQQVSFKATVSLVHAGKPVDPDPRQAAPDEIREWLGSLAKQTEIKVVQPPAVTLREQQEGVIELIHGKPDDWTGMRLKLEVERVGLRILAKDTTEYRPEDRSAPPVGNTSQSGLCAGDPQVSLVSSREGVRLYRVLTLELITATGQPVGDPAGYATASEVPGSPGMVVSPHSGTVIDVRGIPSGTLVQDPTFPASERKYFRVP